MRLYLIGIDKTNFTKDKSRNLKEICKIKRDDRRNGFLLSSGNFNSDDFRWMLQRFEMIVFVRDGFLLAIVNAGSQGE